MFHWFKVMFVVFSFCIGSALIGCGDDDTSTENGETDTDTDSDTDTDAGSDAGEDAGTDAGEDPAPDTSSWWTEDFGADTSAWTIGGSGSGAIELDGVTSSTALHMTSVAGTCGNTEYAERIDVSVPAEATGLSFTLHGDVTEPYGEFLFRITGTEIEGYMFRESTSSTPETIIVCIPPGLRGDTVELFMWVRGNGGTCSNFDAYQVWVDDLQFVLDSTGCEWTLADDD